MNRLLVFCGSQDKVFGTRTAAAADTKLGNVTIKRFSDQEVWVKYGENLRGQDVFIISSLRNDGSWMELFVLIDAAVRASAQRVTVVAPYFGYARQERKDQPRTAITAKLMANLITTAGADRVISMDLHAPAIQGFFDIPVDHLYASSVLIPMFQRKRIPNLTVVAPDSGGIKRARVWAKALNAEIALIDKRRPKQNEAEVMNIIGKVKGRNVLVVDDLIDTAGTFVNVGTALKKEGALKLYGCCTHAVFSENAIQRIQNSPFTMVAVTDTIPLQAGYAKIKTVSVAKIFGIAIKRAHKNESVSDLFLENRDKTDG